MAVAKKTLNLNDVDQILAERFSALRKQYLRITDVDRVLYERRNLRVDKSFHKKDRRVTMQRGLHEVEYLLECIWIATLTKSVLKIFAALAKSE